MEAKATTTAQPGTADFVRSLLTIRGRLCPHNPKIRLTGQQSTFPLCLAFFHQNNGIILLLKTSLLCRGCYDAAVPNGFAVRSKQIRFNDEDISTVDKDGVRVWHFCTIGLESYGIADTVQITLRVGSEDDEALEALRLRAQPCFLATFQSLGKSVPKSMATHDEAVMRAQAPDRRMASFAIDAKKQVQGRKADWPMPDACSTPASGRQAQARHNGSTGTNADFGAAPLCVTISERQAASRGASSKASPHASLNQTPTNGVRINGQNTSSKAMDSGAEPYQGHPTLEACEHSTPLVATRLRNAVPQTTNRDLGLPVRQTTADGLSPRPRNRPQSVYVTTEKFIVTPAQSKAGNQALVVDLVQKTHSTPGPAEFSVPQFHSTASTESSRAGGTPKACVLMETTVVPPAQANPSSRPPVANSGQRTTTKPCKIVMPPSSGNGFTKLSAVKPDTGRLRQQPAQIPRNSVPQRQQPLGGTDRTSATASSMSQMPTQATSRTDGGPAGEKSSPQNPTTPLSASQIRTQRAPRGTNVPSQARTPRQELTSAPLPARPQNTPQPDLKQLADGTTLGIDRSPINNTPLGRRRMPTPGGHVSGSILPPSRPQPRVVSSPMSRQPISGIRPTPMMASTGGSGIRLPIGPNLIRNLEGGGMRGLSGMNIRPTSWPFGSGPRIPLRRVGGGLRMPPKMATRGMTGPMGQGSVPGTQGPMGSGRPYMSSPPGGASIQHANRPQSFPSNHLGGSHIPDHGHGPGNHGASHHGHGHDPKPGHHGDYGEDVPNGSEDGKGEKGTHDGNHPEKDEDKQKGFREGGLGEHPGYQPEEKEKGGETPEGNGAGRNPAGQDSAGEEETAGQPGQEHENQNGPQPSELQHLDERGFDSQGSGPAAEDPAANDARQDAPEHDTGSSPGADSLQHPLPSEHQDSANKGATNGRSGPSDSSETENQRDPPSEDHDGGKSSGKAAAAVGAGLVASLAAGHSDDEPDPNEPPSGGPQSDETSAEALDTQGSESQDQLGEPSSEEPTLGDGDGANAQRVEAESQDSHDVPQDTEVLSPDADAGDAATSAEPPETDAGPPDADAEPRDTNAEPLEAVAEQPSDVAGSPSPQGAIDENDLSKNDVDEQGGDEADFGQTANMDEELANHHEHGLDPGSDATNLTHDHAEFGPEDDAAGLEQDAIEGPDDVMTQGPGLGVHYADKDGLGNDFMADQGFSLYRNEDTVAAAFGDNDASVEDSFDMSPDAGGVDNSAFDPFAQQEHTASDNGGIDSGRPSPDFGEVAQGYDESQSPPANDFWSTPAEDDSTFDGKNSPLESDMFNNEQDDSDLNVLDKVDPEDTVEQDLAQVDDDLMENDEEEPESQVSGQEGLEERGEDLGEPNEPEEASSPHEMEGPDEPEEPDEPDNPYQTEELEGEQQEEYNEPDDPYQPDEFEEEQLEDQDQDEYSDNFQDDEELLDEGNDEFEQPEDPMDNDFNDEFNDDFIEDPMDGFHDDFEQPEEDQMDDYNNEFAEPGEDPMDDYSDGLERPEEATMDDYNNGFEEPEDPSFDAITQDDVNDGYDVNDGNDCYDSYDGGGGYDGGFDGGNQIDYGGGDW